MIKFITEEYLRDVYKKEHFETYEIEQGKRLTPGAAQYLSDKRIKINNNASNIKMDVSKNDKFQIKGTKDKDDKIVKEEVVDTHFKSKKKICLRLKSIEAKCLITSSEILEEDVFLAQDIMNLSKKLSNIRKAIEKREDFESVYFKDCTGINSLNFTSDVDDCFEITDFHMQLKNGKIILKMHILRCILQEFQVEILETFESENTDVKNKIVERVNLIINSLSQLICSAVGGKECQRRKYQIRE